MTRKITFDEVAFVLAIAKENGVDDNLFREAVSRAIVEPEGEDGSFRFCTDTENDCAGQTNLDWIATFDHTRFAKTYVVLWTSCDRRTPCSIECFRVDGTSPQGLPDLSTIKFSSYAKEFDQPVEGGLAHI